MMNRVPAIPHPIQAPTPVAELTLKMQLFLFHQLWINEKLHVVHAARITGENCSKRSCFTSKGKIFEVLCGSSVVDSPTQTIAMIPQGSNICQCKVCLATLDQFLNAPESHGSLEEPHTVRRVNLSKKWGFPFHAGGVFRPIHFAIIQSVLMHKKWANPFHPSCVLHTPVYTVMGQKMGFPISLWRCFLQIQANSRWFTPQKAFVQNGLTHFTPVFCKKKVYTVFHLSVFFQQKIYPDFGLSQDC